MKCELTDCAYNEERECGEMEVKICKIDGGAGLPAGWCICDNYMEREDEPWTAIIVS